MAILLEDKVNTLVESIDVLENKLYFFIYNIYIL